MDQRFLEYYNRELLHVREMGAEFAQLFPKIASRLGMAGIDCADPHVERLLEGFAFLAARVQMKIDDEFPRFTRSLLEVVYPHYLAPTPSLAVAQLVPDRTHGRLLEGFLVPRGTVLRTSGGTREHGSATFTTGAPVTLWPLEIGRVDVVGHGAHYAIDGVAEHRRVRSALRIQLRSLPGVPLARVAADSLPLYLRGSGASPFQIFERLIAGAVDVVVAPSDRSETWRHRLGRSSLRTPSFEPEQALLPCGQRSFDGYRLLQEYFALPSRFLFLEFTGLRAALEKASGNEVEIAVLLDRSDPSLENAVAGASFVPFCAPAVNLFERRTDRVHVEEREHEHHVVVDRTRPLDYEVHSVQRVEGFGKRGDEALAFEPFYHADALGGRRPHGTYFHVDRRPRRLTAREIERGPRSSYQGSEIFVTLVDGNADRWTGEIKQLAVTALCTNRDLPLLMASGDEGGDFTLDVNAPVASVRCLSGPSKPRPSHALGDTAWRLISHLSLNYLSISGADGSGARALREMLALYGDRAEASVAKQIEGLREVQARPVLRRIPTSGPPTVGRGLEVTVTCDELAFEGSGAFVLGAVLERFFAKYVGINSFTETVLRSTERGELMRWPARTGRRSIL